MRAAVYLRLSKDTEASTSIERQRADCERLVRERGWSLSMVEEDVDVSASKRRLDRPGLDRVRAAYAELDAVVFWRVDRLARSIVDFATLMDEAERAGVALVSATEPVDLSTPMGRAMASIVATFAELEARTIGARMKSTIEHLRGQGKEPGGRLPYGWRRVADPVQGWRAELDPEQAPVLREVVDRVLDGEAILTVARDLTARGVPSPGRGDGHWNPTTLHRLLRNPTLRGHAVHRGQVLRDENGLARAVRPSLVAPQEWADLQALLDKRARPSGRQRADALLLAGVAVCGRCGAHLHAQRRLQEGRVYYACSVSGQGRPCTGVTVSQSRLDEHVTAILLDVAGHRLETREVVPARAAAVDAGAVREALDDLERDRYERGLYAGAEGAERFAALHGRLSAQLVVVDVEPEVELTGRTLAEVWAAEGLQVRRQVVAQVVERVTVAPGRRGGGPVAERVEVVLTP